MAQATCLQLNAGRRTINSRNAVRNYPTRFAGFAELPMHEPQEAAKELHRMCSGESEGVRFVGALVDSHTESGLYYDGPEFDTLWETATKLDTPIYIHPTWPADELVSAYQSPSLPENITLSILAFALAGTVMWRFMLCDCTPPAFLTDSPSSRLLSGI